MQAHQLLALLPLLAAPLTVRALPGGACDGSDGLSITWSGNAQNPYYTFNNHGTEGPATGCTDLGAGFTGQVGVSYMGSDGRVHADGTIIELNPTGFFDVSYILGYTLPVVCSSNGASSGCSTDLFNTGASCPTPVRLRQPPRPRWLERFGRVQGQRRCVAMVQRLLATGGLLRSLLRLRIHVPLRRRRDRRTGHGLHPVLCRHRLWRDGQRGQRQVGKQPAQP